ncbi:MAG TPA: ABC transporter transmembrane domain-containing protein [Solirubrobacteraceae bacterium]|nr:ABC transporter transmembrane domain-containing protein [Solirubrobacteraceae bacterium]
MVSLSVAGVLLGLVPPLALGTLVNALVERRDTAEGALLAGVIGLAVAAEAAAYVLSDGFYARAAGGLYLDLRTAMLQGLHALRRRGEEVQGMSARFVSDAETIEQISLSILDSSVMLVVECVSALAAIAILEPVSLAAAAPLLALTWLVTRWMQVPVADASLHRQEALQRMTATLETEFDHESLPTPDSSFLASAQRLRTAEVRLGWLRSANLQGSGGLAKLGPIAVVAVAAFAHVHHPGALVSLYLLAQRAFYGFDGIVDLSLDLNGARGAVNRCFSLIDGRRDTAPRK